MKAWSIAIKDTLIAFRDRNAILLMIAAPLLISMIMGAAFGNQSGDISPISEIPLIFVNLDEGDLGENFADIITSIEVDTAEGTKTLFAVVEMADKGAALEQVELGKTRGVVVIPPGFSEQLQTESDSSAREVVIVEVFTDPAASISPGIMRGVVQRVANGFNTVMIGNIVAIDQLLGTATDIPVILVNSDPGPLGTAYLETFSPENFSDIFIITTDDNVESARKKLDSGGAQAVIQITDGFSQAVMEGRSGVEIARTIVVFSAKDSLSAPIVADAALDIARGFSTDAKTNGDVEIGGVLANLENMADILEAENSSFAETEGARERITINTITLGTGEEFDLLGYFVPSMSIFFLMFAAFEGTRSILAEERDGTLHRLMTTPTSIAQILMGKIGGTFLTGMLQFTVLVLVSSIAFRVHWSDSWLALIIMSLATVFAATSLGAFLASFARNTNQAGSIGTTVNLVFAVLGGNFISTMAFPNWLTVFSKLTINRWALDGFVTLALGGGDLVDILPNVGILCGMAVVFFTLAAALFNRRFVR